MAFTGLQQYTVDLKGRVPTCPEHRDELKGDLVLTLGWKPCILIFAADRFAQYESKLLEKADLLDPTPHDLLRQFIGHKTAVQLDKQSRITLPRIHRKRAGISIEEDENQVVMMGVGDWVECWSKSGYEKWCAEQATEEQLTQRAHDCGIAPRLAPSPEEGAAGE